MENCKTCLYWIAAVSDYQNAATIPAMPVGQCKRYPPTVLMQKFPVDARGAMITSALQKQAGVSETPMAFFPVTPEIESCGAHVPRIRQ